LTQVQTLQRLIESQNTLALSSAAGNGVPHVAPLFYLPGKNLCLYWFSSPSSEHSRNLLRQPEAAVSIFRPTDQWKQIRGAQLRGVVRMVTDSAERSAIAKAYAKRFRLGKLLQTAMAASELFVFEPRWARYVDNSKRLGSRFELTFEPNRR
jgi:uncharacterized protein YhbP (UPF0306 family)